MRLQGSAEIGAPAALIFAIVSTPERLPEWSPSIARARRLDAGPVGLGSRAAMQARLLGQPIESETEVVSFEPGQRFATVGVRGPKLRTTFVLSPTPRGTRVDGSIEGELPGGRLAELVAEPLLRSDFQQSLERLRALCEAEAAAAAAAQ